MKTLGRIIHFFFLVRFEADGQCVEFRLNNKAHAFRLQETKLGVPAFIISGCPCRISSGVCSASEKKAFANLSDKIIQKIFSLSAATQE